MKNNSLAIINDGIVFIPELMSKVRKNVVACLILMRCDSICKKNNGKPFSKFLEPPKKQNDLYVVGSSWVEELGVSVDVFRKAFGCIGISYKSLTQLKTKLKNNGDAFEGKYYLSVYDRENRVLNYMRNHQVTDQMLDELFSSRNRTGEHRNQEIQDAKIRGNDLGNSINNDDSRVLEDLFIHKTSFMNVQLDKLIAENYALRKEVERLKKNQKRKRKTTKTKPPTEVHNACKDYWMEVSDTKNWSGKHAANLNKILDVLRLETENHTKEPITNENWIKMFQHLISKLPDWHRKHNFSISGILGSIDKIIQQIKANQNANREYSISDFAEAAKNLSSEQQTSDINWQAL